MEAVDVREVLEEMGEYEGQHAAREDEEDVVIRGIFVGAAGSRTFQLR